MAVNNSFFNTVLPSVKNVADLTGVETKLYVKLFSFDLITSSKSETQTRKRANYLIRVCENSVALRNWDLLSEASECLLNTPLPQARHAGVYFHAAAMKRRGEREKARGLLQQVAGASPTRYRARAIQSLGVMEEEGGNLNEAARHYREAIYVSREHDLVTRFLGRLALSRIKGLTGDHWQNVAELLTLSERFGPMLRRQSLCSFWYYANLASALADVGRISEAKKAFSLVESSPLASAYPEIAHTREQIVHQSPTTSFVALGHSASLATENESDELSAKRDENIEAASPSPPVATHARQQQACGDIDRAAEVKPRQCSSLRSYTPERLSPPFGFRASHQTQTLTSRVFVTVFQTPYHLLVLERLLTHSIEARAR